MNQLASTAKVISRVTNPCVLSVVVLSLMAYTESSNLWALFCWVSIILLFLVVLPLVYVCVRTSALRGGAKCIADSTTYLKQHPRDIWVLGAFSGLPCLLILVFLEAPSFVISTLVALLATSLVIATFNAFYRVSYHLGAVTILLIMIALTWGQTFLVLLATLPVIGWAKYRLREHTLVQLAMGIGLAVVVSGTILYLLD